MKGLLKKAPPDKKSFEAAMMGRSTRQVTETLGPPKDVLQSTNLVAWAYPTGNTTVLLYIRDDHVYRIEW